MAIIVKTSSNGNNLGLQVTQRAQLHASICETRKNKMTTHLGKLRESSKPLSVRKVLSDCNKMIQPFAFIPSLRGTNYFILNFILVLNWPLFLIYLCQFLSCRSGLKIMEFLVVMNEILLQRGQRTS